MIYKINVENMNLEIEVGELTGGTARIKINGKPYNITIEKCNSLIGGIDTAPVNPSVFSKPEMSAPTVKKPAPAGADYISAPIHGLILDVPVKVGEKVEAGDTVVVIEAMKMENNIVSELSGTVREIKVQKGAHVKTGELIMIIG
ncbi:MAG: biotin/lipoyl-binding protein [Desulfobacteraceae bacterium]|nr:MAG: biotin/lipoyl-binding protein [Desulfobacteraceae bacterium]